MRMWRASHSVGISLDFAQGRLLRFVCPGALGLTPVEMTQSGGVACAFSVLQKCNFLHWVYDYVSILIFRLLLNMGFMV